MTEAVLHVRGTPLLVVDEVDKQPVEATEEVEVDAEVAATATPPKPSTSPSTRLNAAARQSLYTEVREALRAPGTPPSKLRRLMLRLPSDSKVANRLRQRIEKKLAS